MSASLGRWRDSNPTTGVHARQIPAGAHEGDHRDFLRRHERAANEAVQKGRVGLEEIGPQLLDRTADTRTLRIAWDHLKQYGGQAPGPNRLTYDSLENSEVWQLVRVLRQAIKADTYRPGPERKVRIPKTSGKGHRTLTRIMHERQQKRAVERM